MERLVAELAQLWVVARCKCTRLRSWRSQNHLDCLFVEPWIVDQFAMVATEALALNSVHASINDQKKSPCPPDSIGSTHTPNFTESLDSLQTETTTFDKLCFLPKSR